MRRVSGHESDRALWSIVQHFRRSGGEKTKPIRPPSAETGNPRGSPISVNPASGPALGAAIIIILRTFVGIYTEYWTMILGIVLMLLIFFLPEGALGLFLRKTRPADRQEGIDAAG